MMTGQLLTEGLRLGGERRVFRFLTEVCKEKYFFL